uniref:Inhibitor of growth protein N-terminal histone-binding domain-containing protein n=1 Tax=Eptatretus burgeri TaxID=7764 RepID=A0A8C4R3U6_EPTBU
MYRPGSPGGHGEAAAAGFVLAYLDCVESLPLDLQRTVSLLREIDHRAPRSPTGHAPIDHGQGEDQRRR